MGIRQAWCKTREWFVRHGRRGGEHKDYRPQTDSEGLMAEAGKASGAGSEQPRSAEQQASEVAIRQARPRGKNESLEKLQAGFEELIGQLRGINEHLGKQVAQHEELIRRIDEMPALLEAWPGVVANQKELGERLIGQMEANIAKDQQLLSAVEKMPTETAKQTDALEKINHQLAAAADTDVQMTETFRGFNEQLGRLRETTQGHKDSIAQMARTFAASDRYLKYVLTRQNRRFFWIFMTAIGVCVFVVAILTGVVVYVSR